MAGRIATAGIVLFWLAMMGWLVKREVLPNMQQARELARAPTYRQVETLAIQPRTEQMGIYLGRERIGQSVTNVSKADAEGVTLIRNRTDVRVNAGSILPFLPKFLGLDLRMKFSARVREGRLTEFSLVVSPPAGEPFATVDGFPTGNDMTLRIRQGGLLRTETIAFDSRQVLSTDLMPAFTPSQLRVGESWTIRSLDLQTMTVRAAVAKVLRREQRQIAGAMRDAFVVEVPYGSRPGEKLTVWVAPDGEVLMQQFYGFRFEREEPAPNADEAGHD